LQQEKVKKNGYFTYHDQIKHLTQTGVALSGEKNIVKKFSLMLFIFLLLWGCAVGQGQVSAKDDLITQKLEIGKTTKEDTLKILGEPGQIVKMKSNLEIWIYNYTQISGLRNPFIKHGMENNTLYVGFRGDFVEKTYRCVSESGL
jgi:hypothetical protein